MLVLIINIIKLKNNENFKENIFLKKGLVWPAISDIFIRWVPVAEKSRLIGFASAGNNLGNIIALPLGTYLCVDGFAGGWPSIFYIYGIILFVKRKKYVNNRK
jgi:MFS family permease